MNKYLTLSFCLLLLLNINSLKSQRNAPVDSFENILSSHPAEDVAKVILFNELAFSLHLVDRDRALKYTTQAGEISDKLNYTMGQAECLWLKGLCCSPKTKSELALDYYRKAIKLAESIDAKTEVAKYWYYAGIMNMLTENDDKAAECYNRSIQIAEDLNDQQAVAKALYKLSYMYNGDGKYDKAINGYLRALKIAEHVGDKTVEGGCQNGLGLIYAYQGKYPPALEYFQKYLKNKELSNDKMGVFNAINNIGNIYLSTNDFPKALAYFERAYQIAISLRNKRRIAGSIANIGLVYQRMNNKKSLNYFQKALVLGEEIKENPVVISVYMYIGDYYMNQKKLTVAMDNYRTALKKSEEADWKYPMSEIYNKIGSIFLTKKEYAEALSNTLKALDYANEMDLMDSKNAIHKQLSKIYAATNNFSKAYYHQKRFEEINDSVHNDKNTRKIAELEYTYTFEKKKQLLVAEQTKKDAVQRIITYSLLTGILLLLLFAFYVIHSLRSKHKTNLQLIMQNDEIEKLNTEYVALNKEYLVLNEHLKASNIQINNELELNQKSMTAATLKLMQNAERDASTIDRLHEIEQHTRAEGKQSVNAMISDYKRSSYNSNWEEFEILFEKVHSSFYENLNTKFPSLTANERKLCAFLKLNMSNKDIAQITFQSEEALKKARLRLRQKLQIDRETNLSTFIHSV